MKVISSKNNETYKFLVKVSKKSNVRKKNQKFIVEGLKEINLCINSNYEIDSFLPQIKILILKTLFIIIVKKIFINQRFDRDCYLQINITNYCNS